MSLLYNDFQLKREYMQNVIQKIEAKYKKPAVVAARSGDTVRVHQEIVEGSKKRIQVFEGMVIRATRASNITGSITVRKIASGVGVEKTFMLHAPSVIKVEVTKRTKVRRNYLTYMRQRSGKSTRLSGVAFDREAVNSVIDKAAEEELAALKAQQEAEHEAAAKADEAEKAAEEAKIAAALAEREQA